MIRPRLIAITDTTRAGVPALLDAIERLARAARPGSVLLQLRDRELPLAERRALGERLQASTRRHGQALVVNDRLDLAVLLEADGVHLGEASVSVADARAFGARQGRAWFVSVARHEPSAAPMTDADAVLLSPIVEARKGRAPLGVAGVTAAVSACAGRGSPSGQVPAPRLYALGGVTRREVPALLAAGADGVAVIGELFEPGGAEELIAALDIAR